MQKLKEFDAEEFIEQQQLKQDPTGGNTIGEIIRLFLDNQSNIGLRKFAERCNVRRHRLVKIINGDKITEEELDKISTLFTEISKVYAERAAAAKTIKAGLTE